MSQQEKKSVCLKMILSTTSLTHHLVMSMFSAEKDQEVSENGNASESSISSFLFNTTKQTRINPHFNRGNDAHELLDRFLDQLHKMPSYYCRKVSTKLYLDHVFRTVSEVHKAYEHNCSLRQVKPLK